MNHIFFAKKTTIKPKGRFSCKNARLKLELLIFTMTITTCEIRDVFKTRAFSYFYKKCSTIDVWQGPIYTSGK